MVLLSGASLDPASCESLCKRCGRPVDALKRKCEFPTRCAHESSARVAAISVPLRFHRRVCSSTAGFLCARAAARSGTRHGGAGRPPPWLTCGCRPAVSSPWHRFGRSRFAGQAATGGRGLSRGSPGTPDARARRAAHTNPALAVRRCQSHCNSTQGCARRALDSCALARQRGRGQDSRPATQPRVPTQARHSVTSLSPNQSTQIGPVGRGHASQPGEAGLGRALELTRPVDSDEPKRGRVAPPLVVVE